MDSGVHTLYYASIIKKTVAVNRYLNNYLHAECAEQASLQLDQTLLSVWIWPRETNTMGHVSFHDDSIRDMLEGANSIPQ